MRFRPLVPFAIALASACGGGSSSPGQATPPAARAAINVRVPSSVPALVCQRCGDLVGEMQVAVDLVIEETGGLGGEVTGIGVHLLGGTTGSLRRGLHSLYGRPGRMGADGADRPRVLRNEATGT